MLVATRHLATRPCYPTAIIDGNENRMHQRLVRLLDNRVADRPLIEATVARDIVSAPGLLAETEEIWAAARKAEAQSRSDLALPALEHGHWDWRNKADTLKARVHRLIAVAVGAEVQGLMAILQAPRAGRLSRGGIVYVDYLETAPWNLKSGTTPPRFLGVGTILLAEAVHISVELGLEGRIGLHSLPEAEPFYNKCRMTRQGPDQDYFDLVYYEFQAQDAIAWLQSVGGTP